MTATDTAQQGTGSDRPNAFQRAMILATMLVSMTLMIASVIMPQVFFVRVPKRPKT